MASNVLESMTCHNLHIDYVVVNGFAERKLKHNGGLEYIFAVEVNWSDGRNCCVKRTYADFMKFCETLVNDIKCCKENETGIGQRSKYASIPRLKGWIWYKKYDRRLAESREDELNNFIHQLFQRNPHISHNPVVLDFFEQRPSDPVPGVTYDQNYPNHHYLYKISNHFQCCLL